MRRWLIASILGLAGLLGTGSRADAYWGHTGPFPASAAFPCVYPPGYYTNSYYYGWYYPWFAYYNSSHGSFANWYQWGGYATYGNCGPWCGQRPVAPVMASGPAAVAVMLPADARLTFNGVVAEGTGTMRTFVTPPLVPGQDYAYELSIEVLRDGAVRKQTKRVVVLAGKASEVTFVVPK